MKYLKTYESINKYGWKNIYKKANKLYINVYSLISEMEDSVKGLDKHEIAKKEDEYKHLLESLIIGKVISFDCSDCSETHTGICEDVEFHSGFGLDDDNTFQVNFIQIVIEDIEDPHAIDDEEIIVHLNIDPDLYRNMKKYNI